jgi:hypothetical protein
MRSPFRFSSKAVGAHHTHRGGNPEPAGSCIDVKEFLASSDGSALSQACACRARNRLSHRLDMLGSPAIGSVGCGASLQAMRWRALKFPCGKAPTPGKCGVGAQRRVSNCREALLPTLSILDAAAKGGNSNFCSSTDRFRGGTQSQPEGRSISRSRKMSACQWDINA